MNEISLIPGHAFAGDMAADDLFQHIQEAIALKPAKIFIDWDNVLVVSSTYAYFYQLLQALPEEEKRRIIYNNVGSASRASMHRAIEFVKSKGR